MYRTFLGGALAALMLPVSSHAAASSPPEAAPASVAACFGRATDADDADGVVLDAAQGWLRDDPLGDALPADAASGAEAARRWRPLAEKGDPRAQAGLAYLLEQGLGVERDYAEAVKWYRAAAKAGVTYAQSALGTFYARGTGVAPYWAEARRWWTLAATGGDRRAQLQLALAYRAGRGGPRDEAVAQCLLRDLAQSGDVDAQRTLGEIAFGQRAFAEAGRWYAAAAAAGDERARTRLGLQFLRGQGVAKDATQAAALLQAGAAAGDAEAMAALGALLATGEGMPQDRAKALTFSRRAAALGNADAMNNLAALIERGENGTRDPERALIWYERAAALGSAAARRNIDRLVPTLGDKQVMRARATAARCARDGWEGC